MSPLPTPSDRLIKAMTIAVFAILSTALVRCAAPAISESAGAQENRARAQGEYFQYDPPDDQKPEFRLEKPDNVRTLNTSVSAALGPLGNIPFDGNLIPLVAPGGHYVAVQESRTAQYWNFILARPTDALVPRFTIAVYRVDLVDGGPRQELVKIHTLENIGLLGRHADDDGFLVELPKGDGTRKIGVVNWQTGEVAWILSRDVNAFATRSKNGRLAWCARPVNASPVEFGKAVDDAPFDLYVQVADSVVPVPARDGSWLMPIWSDDGVTLFAFHLKPDGQMEIAVFNTTSAQTMKAPRQSTHVSYQGSAYWTFQATAATRNPAAPDGSPRFVFFMPGQTRMYEYDARRDAQTRLRALPHNSVAAAWRSAEEIICSTTGSLYWLSTTPEVEPIELIKGLNIPFTTTSKDRPFVLVSRDASRSDRLNLWAMQLIDRATVQKAVENLPDRNR